MKWDVGGRLCGEVCDICFDTRRGEAGLVILERGGALTAIDEVLELEPLPPERVGLLEIGFAL